MLRTVLFAALALAALAAPLSSLRHPERDAALPLPPPPTYHRFRSYD